MSSDRHDTRRAMRLLRWYPSAWRERYGEEFVDHLKQEFADRPVDLLRSVNVAYKGLVARVGDLGLSNSNANLGSQTRAALGTSLACIALVVVIMLDFWSRAMLAWSGRRYHPIPVSATTGMLTVAMGLLVVVLVAVVLAVVVLVARQMLRRRARRLVGPSMLAVASGGFLLYSGARSEFALSVHPPRRRPARNEPVPAGHRHYQPRAGHLGAHSTLGSALGSRLRLYSDDADHR